MWTIWSEIKGFKTKYLLNNERNFDDLSSENIYIFFWGYFLFLIYETKSPTLMIIFNFYISHKYFSYFRNGAGFYLFLFLSMLIFHPVQSKSQCPSYCFFAGRCFCNAGYHSLGGKRSVSISFRRDGWSGHFEISIYIYN